ncbi:MAG: dienelactone hydrolase family protein [Candidatus Bathyarchaeota archaeon]
MKIEDICFDGSRGKIYCTLYSNGKLDAGVVLCPPHPLYGGSRNDMRLTFLARNLVEKGITALCIDYFKEYSSGVGEVQDVVDSALYMLNHVKNLGLLGYSFGAVVASVVSVKLSNIKGLVLVSPVEKIDNLKIELSSNCPKLFIHGKYDQFTSLEKLKILYNSAKGKKDCIIFDTDHFYMDFNILKELSDKIYSFFYECFRG